MGFLLATILTYLLSYLFNGDSDPTSGIPTFICNDGTELQFDRVCNGPADCPDATDESAKLCHRVLCPPDMFRCTYGACVTRESRCNGTLECFDGSDEHGCDVKDTCVEPAFQCLNSHECIQPSDVCNGKLDCKDGSDEGGHCRDKPCPPNTFQCTLGGCVYREVTCDGFKDCSDGSDETIKDCSYFNCLFGCDKFKCKAEEFSCESGNQCLAKSKVCDGTLDCRDGSDESNATCSSHTCNEGQFRCSYGACIDVTLTCNKQQNCLDWSDEDGALCGPELLNKACRLPPARPGTFYETSTCESCRPGRVVDEATRLDFHCHEGWNLVGWNKSFCQNGRWQPAIPNCFSENNVNTSSIECQPVSAPGATKQCKSSWGAGEVTSCDVPVPPGTQLHLKCLDYYQRESGSSRATCLHDGTWSQTPLHCIPICGDTGESNVATLVIKGWRPERLFPWHISLFTRVDGKWSYICCGTLISERAVMTAAHCVWKSEAKDLKIILNGNSSDFYKQSVDTRVAEIDKIRVQESYQDYLGNYNSDIAILILSKPVKIDAKVLPACLDWNNRRDVSQRVGEVGFAAGMGITELDTFSPNVMMTSLKLVPQKVCQKNHRSDFKKYVTYSSFCAGWANGSAVCNGDSGGGLMLRNPNGRWEVHGIVSVSPRKVDGQFCDPDYYTIFTKVSVYLKWIRKVLSTIVVD